mgnify:CR=1 FL=1
MVDSFKGLVTNAEVIDKLESIGFTRFEVKDSDFYCMKFLTNGLFEISYERNGIFRITRKINGTNICELFLSFVFQAHIIKFLIMNLDVILGHCDRVEGNFRFQKILRTPDDTLFLTGINSGIFPYDYISLSHGLITKEKQNKLFYIPDRIS